MELFLRAQTSQSTSCTMFCIYYYTTATCFGHISWPSSGS